MFRLPHCERDFSLQPVWLIFAEALAEHLARVADDEEGGRVDLVHQPLDRHDLAAADGAEQHGLVVVRIGSLGGQAGDAQAEAAAGRLGLDDQAELLAAIMTLTMPQGIGPFVDKLSRMGFNPVAGGGSTKPDTHLPKP